MTPLRSNARVHPRCQSRKTLARVYAFEFTVTGEQRHPGSVTQFGAHSAQIELAPYPFEIKTPPRADHVIQMQQWRQEHKRWHN